MPSAPPVHAGGSVAAVVRRVGGVPLVFVGAGVLVGVLVLWRSQAKAAPAPAADQADGTADGSLSPVTSTTPSYLVVGNNAPTGTGPVDATNPGAPTDNVTWQRRAETQLIALGYDPILVDQALTLYLTGQSLTQQQGAIVSLALAKFGPPPSPPAAPIVQGPSPDLGGNLPPEYTAAGQRNRDAHWPPNSHISLNGWPIVVPAAGISPSEETLVREGYVLWEYTDTGALSDAQWLVWDDYRRRTGRIGPTEGRFPTSPAPSPAPSPSPGITPYVPGGPINGPIQVPTNPTMPIRG